MFLKIDLHSAEINIYLEVDLYVILGGLEYLVWGGKYFVGLGFLGFLFSSKMGK